MPFLCRIKIHLLLRQSKQEHGMRVPMLGCSCIKILEHFKSKKGQNFLKKKYGGLPHLLVQVPLLIVNNYSEFQVNIFSNNRDIRKCQSFRTPPP